jgi:D-glycero-D-manno-heptose 1,7-bisphosphate phosphatase
MADLAGVTAVFLDRDGTINVKAPDGEYVTDPAGLVLLPGSAAAVARLNAAGLPVILVTNQRWLSRPGAEPARYAAVHARLGELLAEGGARLDAAYHCPHPAGECACRKPAPGLLLQAASEHGIDLAASVMIGDSESDVLAGRAAGTRTILLQAGQRARPGTADALAPDLAAAADLLLGAGPG